MRISLFVFSQLFLQIYAKQSLIYNCESLCFGLNECIKHCTKAGLQRQEYIPESNVNSMQDETSNKNNEDEDSVLQSALSTAKDSIIQSVLTSTSSCGLRKETTLRRVIKGVKGMGRIVGGEDALPHEFPWQITMQIFIPKKGKIEHFCGGSILNSHYILTAAHCLDVLVGKESKIIVKMGSNKMMDDSVPNYTVEKLKIHENWSRNTQSDDIALMRIKEEIKVKLNDKNQYEVNTICLPEKDSEPKGSATLSGWGQTGVQAEHAQYLQKIDLPIYDQQKCTINYEKYVKISDTKLCAGGKGGADSCMGDSGGPLIQVIDGRAVQIGVVSFGFPCAVKDMPGVYTKLSKYLDWIHKNML